VIRSKKLLPYLGNFKTLAEGKCEFPQPVTNVMGLDLIIQIQHFTCFNLSVASNTVCTV